jgi:hypothetical protein
VQNGFTGTVPGSLAGAKELQMLDLSYNSLEGDIPDDWKSEKLRNVSFASNKLEGAGVQASKGLRGQQPRRVLAGRGDLRAGAGAALGTPQLRGPAEGPGQPAGRLARQAAVQVRQLPAGQHAQCPMPNALPAGHTTPSLAPAGPGPFWTEGRHRTPAAACCVPRPPLLQGPSPSPWQHTCL